MQLTVKVAGLFIAAVAASILLAGVSVSAEAHAAEENNRETRTYSYVANAGDSYTQLVRKAVQTYGIIHEVDLGEGRIVAIETIASERSGWPMLNEGQTVGFSENLVKSWIDEAMKLGDSDVAAWATYAPYIDFDTRHIGE